jgi:hypothetical protein
VGGDYTQKIGSSTTVSLGFAKGTYSLCIYTNIYTNFYLTQNFIKSGQTPVNGSLEDPKAGGPHYYNTYYFTWSTAPTWASYINTTPEQPIPSTQFDSSSPNLLTNFAYDLFSTLPALVLPPAASTVPGAPSGLVATAGNGQASIAFTAGSTGGSSITNYQYSTDGTTFTAFSSPQTSSPVTITGLTNGTTYTVYLKAVNSNGSGATSSSTSVTPSTSPGAPSGLVATAGNGQVSIAFTAGSTGGSAITDYQYSTNGTTYTSVGKNSSPVTITGLTNGTSYSIYLKAVNAIGAGTASTAVSVTPVNMVASQPLTHYSGTQGCQAYSSHSQLKSVSISFTDMNFSKSSGVAYGVDVVYSGVVSKFSMTALDSSNNSLTDFNSNPLNLSLSLPNANTSSTLQIFKVDDTTGVKIDPQPSGLPATLSYNAGADTWSGSLKSLSTYIIQDATNSSGSLGGDPYLRNFYGDLVLIPNDWTYFRFFENKRTDEKVMIHCDLLDVESDLAKNLHKIGEEKKVEKSPVAHNMLTFITQVEIWSQGKLVVVIDTLNGQVLKYVKNTGITLDNIESKGVRGSTNIQLYPPSKSLVSYAVNLRDSIRLIITIDNFWEEINNIEVILTHEKHVEHLEGEFFLPSSANKVATFHTPPHPERK